MKGSNKHPVTAASDANMKRTRLCRFLQIFMFFILFIIFTLMIAMQASDSHFLEEATHFFNLTSTAELINGVPSHLADLKDKLLHTEGTDDALNPILSNPIFGNVASKLGISVLPVDSTEMSSNMGSIWESAEALLQRTDAAVEWLSNVPPEEQKYIFRFDTVSYNEAHIVYKLRAGLKKLLRNKTPEAAKKLSDLVQGGYQCSTLQASQQEAIARFIKMDICSEIEWYKVVQIAWPEARQFLDVGANKGYLGSLFVALWGGNGLQLAPSDVLKAATRLESWKDSRNPAGYCQDGFSHGIPLFCPAGAARDKHTGKCDVINADLRVTSFDGSSYLMQTLNHIIRTETPIRLQTAPIRDGKYNVLLRLLPYFSH
jgi:hypothetical protein